MTAHGRVLTAIMDDLSEAEEDFLLAACAVSADYADARKRLRYLGLINDPPCAHIPTTLGRDVARMIRADRDAPGPGGALTADFGAGDDFPDTIILDPEGGA